MELAALRLAHPPPERWHADRDPDEAPFRAPLDSARPRPARDAGDLEPSIYLDAVRQAASGRDRRFARLGPGDFHPRRHPADLVLASAGLADRSFRRPVAHHRGSGAVRPRLGARELRRFARGALRHLRPVLRPRHRPRLCRRGRPDGALVSRSPGLCDRPRRRRLWHGRARDHLSHRCDDPRVRLSGDAAAVRSRPRGDRNRRGAVPSRPADRRGRDRLADRDRAPRRRPARDARNALILADVRDDDDDVDRRSRW